MGIGVAPPLVNVTLALDHNSESIGERNNELYDATLQATKFLFDRALGTEKKSFESINNLIQALSSLNRPKTRSMTKKQLQTGSIEQPLVKLHPTPLTSLHVEGMNDQQLWTQLELRTERICDALSAVTNGKSDIDYPWNYQDDDEVGLEDGDEEEVVDYEEALDMEGEADGEEMDLDLEESEISQIEEEEEQSPPSDEDFDEGPEHTGVLRDPSSEPSDYELNYTHPVPLVMRGKDTRSNGHPILDDGFFSLAEFNAETEESEARASSNGRLSVGSDEEGTDVEDQVIDLFAPLDQNPGAFEEEDLEDADSSHIFYKDFFRPPKYVAQKEKSATVRTSKVKFHEEVRIKEIQAKNRGRSAKELRALPFTARVQQLDVINEDGLEDDEEYEAFDNMVADNDPVELDDDPESIDEDTSQGVLDDGDRTTIERFKDDLFEDGDADSRSMAGLSTHEMRIAAITRQIAELEAENMGDKDWTLMGEATSKKRPHNSLLEEDLDFEQVQRPVPAVTTERVASLEEKIKRRILESRFDDVERKRPVDEKAFLPSRYFELKDTKSQQSLAQIYEEEFMAEKSGNTIDERDSRVQKEHEALEKLWEEISGKLDALCNAHFVPKQPRAKIESVSNIASATLETALPTFKSTGCTLTPKELFSPGTSDLRGRSELTPTEKRVLRSKERKAWKRARDKLNMTADKLAYNRKKPRSAAERKSKEAALKVVVKSGRGVTVVGTKLSALDGKKKSLSVDIKGGSLKL